MTVFKGFLTIAKRNIGMLIMYIVIFLVICLTIQKTNSSDNSLSFKAESINIAVIDRDGGTLAKGLT